MDNGAVKIVASQPQINLKSRFSIALTLSEMLMFTL